MPKNLYLRDGTMDIPLESGSFLIGRSPDCSVVFGSGRVSRRHARVSVSEGGVFVEDLGSRNGTFINGVQVTGKARLEVGDHLIIASRSLQLVAREGSDAPRRDAGDGSAKAGAWQPVSERNPLSDSLGEAPDGATRQEDALSLMGVIADKLFALGKGQEAEAVLTPRLRNLLRQANTKGRVPPGQAEIAVRQAIKLARRTNKAEWIDYVFSLYALTGELLPPDVVEELYSVIRQVPPIRLELLRGYVETIERRSGRLAPPERFLLSRIKGLDGLAAAR